MDRALSGLAERGPVLLAPQAPHHRVWRVGTAVVPRSNAASPGYLLGGWSMAPMFVYQSGQPWDMPGNVDLAPGVDLAEIALAGQEGRAVHLRREAVHRPAQRDDRQLRPAGRLDRVRLHRAVLPDPRNLPAPHGDVPLRRVPPPVVLAGGRELREDDADHEQRSAPGASRGVQPLQQPACTTSVSTTRTPTVGGLRPHQPQHHRAVELPAVHPAGLPADLLDSRIGERCLGGVPRTLRLKSSGLQAFKQKLTRARRRSAA